jgi:hypothetical protein
MPYTPINLQILSAAFAGAMAAFGASAYQGSFIQPFSVEATVALVFAQAVDTQWNNVAAPTVFEVETCYLASLLLMRDRGSFPNTARLNDVTNWTASAIQIVGCILAGDVRATASGIVFPVVGGGGGGSAVGVAGSVQFSGGAGNFAADGATFRFDNVAKRLGLGTSAAAPTEQLDVGGSIIAQLQLKVPITGSVITPQIRDNNNNKWLEVTSVVNAVNDIIIKNAATGNNPGIKPDGTDPNAGLDIESKGTGTVRLAPGTDSTDAVGVFQAGLVTEFVRVDSTNKRVGIGAATAPAFTLDVTGNQRVSSDLTIGGTLDPSTVSLGNFAGGGSIGTAASTVNIAITIEIAQTTAGQTLTVPSPTNATPNKIVTIQNTGSASFIMLGEVVPANQGFVIQWTGAAWIPTSTTGVRLYAQANLAGPTNRLVTIGVINTWTIQPSGANFYQSNAASAFFSISTTSGIITYTGPTRNFLLTGALTFFLAGAVAEFVECVVALNAELVGTTTDSVLAQAVTEAPINAHTLNPNRITPLVSGDTIKTLVRNGGSTQNITYVRFTLTAQELSR